MGAVVVEIDGSDDVPFADIDRSCCCCHLRLCLWRAVVLPVERTAITFVVVGESSSAISLGQETVLQSTKSSDTARLLDGTVDTALAEPLPCRCQWGGGSGAAVIA